MDTDTIAALGGAIVSIIGAVFGGLVALRQISLHRDVRTSLNGKCEK